MYGRGRPAECKAGKQREKEIGEYYEIRNEDGQQYTAPIIVDTSTRVS
jgi:hypothetical protein